MNVMAVMVKVKSRFNLVGDRGHSIVFEQKRYRHNRHLGVGSLIIVQRPTKGRIQPSQSKT